MIRLVLFWTMLWGCLALALIRTSWASRVHRRLWARGDARRAAQGLDVEWAMVTDEFGEDGLRPW